LNKDVAIMPPTNTGAVDSDNKKVDKEKCVILGMVSTLAQCSVRVRLLVICTSAAFYFLLYLFCSFVVVVLD